MSARRCSLCGVSYPNVTQFQTCPIHGEPTDYFSNVDPDPDWQKSMERIEREIERVNELTRDIPLARGVESFEDDGLLWVEQDAMFRAGVRINSAFGGFRLFELEDGWVYETQGWDEPRRRWWVERVIRSAEEETSQPTTSADVPSSTESATD